MPKRSKYNIQLAPEIIKALRHAMGLSQFHFSRQFKPVITSSTVSRWETRWQGQGVHNRNQIIRMLKKYLPEVFDMAAENKGKEGTE